MNKLFFITLFFFITGTATAQSLPDGYILLYQQDFSSGKAIQDFRFSNPDSWKIASSKENGFMEFTARNAYEPGFPSPVSLAVIKDHIFGDFILEAGLMQTGNAGDPAEMGILFSVRDSSRFYYISFSSRQTDSTQGIFLVKNASFSRVSDRQTDSIAWGDRKWHKVRIERNIVNRTVSVYFDDMIQPVMVTKDPELVMGYLGFGSFSSAGRIDNIKVWAPTSIPEKAVFFEEKR